MKRLLPVVLIVFLICGCSDTNDELSRAMDLRGKFLSSGCSFTAEITADYGTKTHSFTLECNADCDGNLSFTVQKPETIQGIAGKLSASGGQLTFDDIAVSFEMLADGEVSPVSSVWIFINTLRGGYIRSCGMDGNTLRLTIDDSYEQEALQLDIWISEENVPQYYEILWQGRRILSINVSNFQFV